MGYTGGSPFDKLRVTLRVMVSLSNHDPPIVSEAN